MRVFRGFRAVRIAGKCERFFGNILRVRGI
jgi:hypothetical protein